jgi:hypothetical protein
MFDDEKFKKSGSLLNLITKSLFLFPKGRNPLTIINSVIEKIRIALSSCRIYK